MNMLAPLLIIVYDFNFFFHSITLIGIGCYNLTRLADTAVVIKAYGPFTRTPLSIIRAAISKKHIHSKLRRQWSVLPQTSRLHYTGEISKSTFHSVFTA